MTNDDFNFSGITLPTKEETDAAFTEQFGDIFQLEAQRLSKLTPEQRLVEENNKRLEAEAAKLGLIPQLSAVDGDNIRETYANGLTRNNRIAAPEGGTFDAYETKKDDAWLNKKSKDDMGRTRYYNLEKMEKQRNQLNIDMGWDAGTATNEDVWARGADQTKALEQKLLQGGELTPAGDQGKYGRNLVNYTDAKGEDYATASNNPKNNSAYNSEWNTQARRDLEQKSALKQIRLQEKKGIVTDLELDTFSGQVENNAQAVKSGVVTLGEKAINTAPTAISAGINNLVDGDDRAKFKEIKKREMSGEPLTKELEEFKNETRLEEVDQSDPFATARTFKPYDELSTAEELDNFAGAVKERSDEIGRSRVNRTQMEKQEKELKGKATQAAKEFEKGEYFSSAATLVKGVGNALGNHPAASITLALESAPEMVSSIYAAAPTVIANTADRFDKGIEEFKKNHDGRYPEDGEVTTLLATASASSVLDTYVDRFLGKGLTQAGLSDTNVVKKMLVDMTKQDRAAFKAAAVALNTTPLKLAASVVGGMGAEFVQEGTTAMLDQYGGKQDADKLDWVQGYAEAGAGAAAGGVTKGAVDSLNVVNNLTEDAKNAGKLLSDSWKDPVAEKAAAEAAKKVKADALKDVKAGKNAEFFPDKTPSERMKILSEDNFEKDNKDVDATKRIRLLNNELAGAGERLKDLGNKLEDEVNPPTLADVEAYEEASAEYTKYKAVLDGLKSAEEPATAKRIEDSAASGDAATFASSVNESLVNNYGSKASRDVMKRLDEIANDNTKTTAVRKIAKQASKFDKKLQAYGRSEAGKNADQVRDEILGTERNNQGEIGLRGHMGNLADALADGDKEAFDSNITKITRFKEVLNEKYDGVRGALRKAENAIKQGKPGRFETTLGFDKDNKPKKFVVHATPNGIAGVKQMLESRQVNELDTIQAGIDLMTAQAAMAFRTKDTEHEISAETYEEFVAEQVPVVQRPESKAEFDETFSKPAEPDADTLSLASDSTPESAAAGRMDQDVRQNFNAQLNNTDMTPAQKKRAAATMNDANITVGQRSKIFEYLGKHQKPVDVQALKDSAKRIKVAPGQTAQIMKLIDRYSKNNDIPSLLRLKAVIATGQKNQGTFAPKNSIEIDLAALKKAPPTKKVGSVGYSEYEGVNNTDWEALQAQNKEAAESKAKKEAYSGNAIDGPKEPTLEEVAEQEAAAAAQSKLDDLGRLVNNATEKVTKQFQKRLQDVANGTTKMTEANYNRWIKYLNNNQQPISISDIKDLVNNSAVENKAELMAKLNDPQRTRAQVLAVRDAAMGKPEIDYGNSVDFEETNEYPHTIVKDGGKGRSGSASLDSANEVAFEESPEVPAGVTKSTAPVSNLKAKNGTKLDGTYPDKSKDAATKNGGKLTAQDKAGNVNGKPPAKPRRTEFGVRKGNTGPRKGTTTKVATTLIHKVVNSLGTAGKKFNAKEREAQRVEDSRDGGAPIGRRANPTKENVSKAKLLLDLIRSKKSLTREQFLSVFREIAKANTQLAIQQARERLYTEGNLDVLLEGTPEELFESGFKNPNLMGMRPDTDWKVANSTIEKTFPSKSGKPVLPTKSELEAMTAPQRMAMAKRLMRYQNAAREAIAKRIGSENSGITYVNKGGTSPISQKTHALTDVLHMPDMLNQLIKLRSVANDIVEQQRSDSKMFLEDKEREPLLALLNMETGEYPAALMDAMTVTALEALNGDLQESRNHWTQQQMEGFLKLDKDSTISAKAAGIIGNNGLLRSNLVNRLGKVALKAANVKTTADTDGLAQGKLEDAAGMFILGILVKNGDIVANKVRFDEIAPFVNTKDSETSYDENGDAVNTVDSAVDNDSLVVFYKVTDTAERTPAQRAEARENNKELNKLLANDREHQFPSDKPVESVLDEDGNTPYMAGKDVFTRVSKKIAQGLDRANKMAYTPKANVFELFEKLDPKRYAAYLGYIEDIEGQHISKHAGIKGKNSSVEKSMRNLDDYMAQREADYGDEKYTKELFFSHRIIKNNRMFVNEKLINMQADKNHRHLFGLVAQNNTIQADNSDKSMDNFMFGLALSFDEATTTTTADDFRKNIYNPETQTWGTTEKAAKLEKGVDAWLRNKDKDVLDDFAQDAIFEALGVHDEGAASMDAFVALATMIESLKKGEKSFDTNLFIEIDGVSNGLISTQLQYPMSDMEMSREFLRVGGIIFNGDELKSVAAQKEAGKLDNYERTTLRQKALLDTLPDANQDVMDAFDILQDELIIADKDDPNVGKVSKAGRKAGKKLMLKNYSIGKRKLMDQVGDSLIESIYDKLVAAKDDPTKFADLVARINVLTRRYRDRDLGLTKPISISAKNVLEFQFSEAQETVLRQRSDQYRGVTTWDAMSELLGDTDQNTGYVNNAMRFVSEVFTHRLNKDIAARQKEIGRHLQKDEMRDIFLEYVDAGLVPGFMHPTSEGATDSIQIVNTTKTAVNANDGGGLKTSFGSELPYNTITNFNRKGEGTTTAAEVGDMSATGQVKETVYDANIGNVAGLAAAIAIDATTNGIMQFRFDMGNMHDAGTFGINDSVEMSKAINEEYHKAHEWSAINAVADKFDSALAVFESMTPEEQAEIEAELLTVKTTKKNQSGDEYDSYDDKGLRAIGELHFDSIELLKNGFNEQKAGIEARRKQLRSEWIHSDQYSNAHSGGFDIEGSVPVSTEAVPVETAKATPTENRAARAAIKGITESLEDADEASIDEVRQEGIAELDKFKTLGLSPKLQERYDAFVKSLQGGSKEVATEAEVTPKEAEAEFSAEVREEANKFTEALTNEFVGKLRTQKQRDAVVKALNDNPDITMKELGKVPGIGAATVKALKTFAASKDINLNSKLDGIDTASFTGVNGEVVTEDNVLGIFDNMVRQGNRRDSAEHIAHLRKQLESTVAPVIGKIKELKLYERVSGNESVGMAQINDIASKASIFIQHAAQSVSMLPRMSSQEVMAHELDHVMWSQGLKNRPSMARNIRRLALQAKKHVEAQAKARGVEPHDMFLNKNAVGETIYLQDKDAEIAAAKEMYDHIFNDPDYIQEFATQVRTNEVLRKAVGNLTTRLPKKQPASILEFLKNMMEELVDFFTRYLTRTKGTTINEELEAMAKSINNIADKNFDGAKRRRELVSKGNAKLAGKFSQYVAAPYLKMVSKRLAARQEAKATMKAAGTKPGVARKVVSATETVLSLPAYVANGEVREATLAVSDKLGIARDNEVYALMREIRGTHAGNAVWHRMQSIERKLNSEAMNVRVAHTRLIKESFSNEGKDIPEETWQALTKVVLKTELFQIAQHVPVDRLVDMVRGGKALQEEIAGIQKTLHKNYGRNANHYIKMAENLGHHAAQGRSGQSMTLLNGHNIANMVLVPPKVSKPHGDLILAEELIERLAGLYGLRYTSKDSRDLVATVIENEYAESRDFNGISAMFNSQQMFKENSLTTLFKDDKTAVEFGYIQDVADPYVTTQVASLADEEAMSAKGFALVGVIPLDPHDTSKAQPAMYQSNLGLTKKRVSGNTNLANRSSAGTSVKDTYSMSQGIEKLQEKSKTEQDMYDKGLADMLKDFTDSPVKLDFSKNFAVPVMGPNGITEFRYMAKTETKERVLKTNNTAYDVLGKMTGSVTSKHQRKSMDRLIVLQAKRDMDTMYKQSPNSFVKMDKDSTDPKIKELARMFSSDMKEDIKEIWGTQDMYIQKSMVDQIFGFKKKSLVNALSKFIGGEKPGSQLIPMLNMIRHASLVWEGIVARGKQVIVIFMPEVVTANITSNIVMSVLGYGMSPVQVVKYQLEGLKEIRAFSKNQSDRDILIQKLKVNQSLTAAERKSMNNDLVRLNADLKNSPAFPLVEQGAYTTVVEDTIVDDDVLINALSNSFPNIATKAKKHADKLPNSVKALHDYVFLKRSTQAGKEIYDATTHSDFVARYGAYKYLTEEKGVSSSDAIQQVMDDYVSYDVNTSPLMQWANDKGVFMFSKFFLRIQKVILKMLMKSPGNLVAGELLQRMFADLPEPTDSVLTPFSVYDKVNVDPMPILDSATDLPAFTMINGILG